MKDFDSFNRVAHVDRLTTLLNERHKGADQRTYCATRLSERAALIAKSNHLPVEHIQTFPELVKAVPIHAIAGYLLSKSKIQTRHHIAPYHELADVDQISDHTYQVACPCTWKHTHVEGHTLHSYGGTRCATLEVEVDQILYNCKKCKYKFRMHDLNVTLRGLVGQHPHYFHTKSFDHVLTETQQVDMIKQLFGCWNTHQRRFDFERATKIIEAPFIGQRRNGTSYVDKNVFLEYHTLMSLMSEAFQGASHVTARKGYGHITRQGIKALFDPFGFAPITKPDRRYRNTVYVMNEDETTRQLLYGYSYNVAPWKAAPHGKASRHSYFLLPLDIHGKLNRPTLDSMRARQDIPFLAFRPSNGSNDTTLLHGITPQGHMVPLKPDEFTSQQPVVQYLPVTLTYEQILSFYDFSRNPLNNIGYLYPADKEIKPFLETVGTFHANTADMLSGFPETTYLKDHNVADYLVQSLSTPRLPDLDALHDELDAFVLQHGAYLIKHAHQWNDDNDTSLDALQQAALAWQETHPPEGAFFNRQQNKLLYLTKKWLFEREATRRGYPNRRLEDYPKKVAVDTSPTGSGKSYYAAKIARQWREQQDTGRTVLVSRSPYSATPTIKDRFTFIVGRSREDRVYYVNAGSRRVTPAKPEDRLTLNAKCEKLDEINAYAADMEYDAAVKKVCNKNHCPLFEACQARTLVKLSHEYAADREHDVVVSETAFHHSQQFCAKKDLVIFDDTDIEHAELTLQGKTKRIVEHIIDEVSPLWDQVSSNKERYLTAILREKVSDAIRGRVSKRVKFRLERFLDALHGEWSLTRGLKAIVVRHTPCLHVPSVVNALYLCATTNYDDVRAYFKDFEMIENVTRRQDAARPHTVLVEHDKFVGNWATNTNMIHYLVEDIHRVRARHGTNASWGMVTHKFNINFMQDRLGLKDLLDRFGFFTLFKKTPHYGKFRDYYPVHVKATKAFKEFEAHWRQVAIDYIDHEITPEITNPADQRCWTDIKNWVHGYRALYKMRNDFVYIAMGNVKSNNVFHEHGIQHVIQLGDARVSQDAIAMKHIEPSGDAFIANGGNYQHFPLHSPEAMCNARLSQQVVGRVRANRYDDACFHYLVGVTVPYVAVDELIGGYPSKEDAPVSRYKTMIKEHIGEYWYDRKLSKFCERDRLIREQTTNFIEKRLAILLNKAPEFDVLDAWIVVNGGHPPPFTGSADQWDKLKSFIIEDIGRRINMSVLDICRALLELGVPLDELVNLRVFWWKQADREKVIAHAALIQDDPFRKRLLEIHRYFYQHVKEQWRHKYKPPPDLVCVA